jgi:hypothetical protein
MKDTQQKINYNIVYELPEAAKILNVKTSTLKDWIRTGVIPGDIIFMDKIKRNKFRSFIVGEPCDDFPEELLYSVDYAAKLFNKKLSVFRTWLRRGVIPEYVQRKIGGRRYLIIKKLNNFINES